MSRKSNTICTRS